MGMISPQKRYPDNDRSAHVLFSLNKICVRIHKAVNAIILLDRTDNKQT